MSKYQSPEYFLALDFHRDIAFACKLGCSEGLKIDDENLCSMRPEKTWLILSGERTLSRHKKIISENGLSLENYLRYVEEIAKSKFSDEQINKAHRPLYSKYFSSSGAFYPQGRPKDNMDWMG